MSNALNGNLCGFLTRPDPCRAFVMAMNKSKKKGEALEAKIIHLRLQ